MSVVGAVWPVLAVMGIYQWVCKVTGITHRLELLRGKRVAILTRLLGNHPDWFKSRDSIRLQNMFVRDYLTKHNKEGLKLLKDPSIDAEEFKEWVKQNVNHPIHEYGLHPLVYGWETNERSNP